MASLETPGVSLFFRLPGPEQPGAVLEDMLRVARDIGKSLGGDLKDENMSVLTGQTLSHFKQRMVEFRARECRCARRMGDRGSAAPRSRHSGRNSGITCTAITFWTIRRSRTTTMTCCSPGSSRWRTCIRT